MAANGQIELRKSRLRLVSCFSLRDRDEAGETCDPGGKMDSRKEILPLVSLLLEGADFRPRSRVSHASLSLRKIRAHTV